MRKFINISESLSDYQRRNAHGNDPDGGLTHTEEMAIINGAREAASAHDFLAGYGSELGLDEPEAFGHMVGKADLVGSLTHYVNKIVDGTAMQHFDMDLPDGWGSFLVDELLPSVIAEIRARGMAVND